MKDLSHTNRGYQTYPLFSFSWESFEIFHEQPWKTITVGILKSYGKYMKRM